MRRAEVSVEVVCARVWTGRCLARGLVDSACRWSVHARAPLDTSARGFFHLSIFSILTIKAQLYNPA